MTGLTGVIDTHHHVWDPDRRVYGFLQEPANAPIRRAFDERDLAQAVRPHGVVQTIAVQAAPALEETEELLELALESSLIGGVVGWLDLDDSDTEGQLRRLFTHSGATRLVGIRAMAQDHPDPDWLARTAVRRAMGVIAEAGLVCELLVRPPQLRAARALVQGLPDATFVLDHGAKPDIAAGSLHPWATAIGELARCENLVCKVSGLVTEAVWDGWSASAIKPYVEVLAGAFGPRRLMFGSDWPVCLLAGSYADVITLARATVGGLDDDAVFAATARRVYRLLS